MFRDSGISAITEKTSRRIPAINSQQHHLQKMKAGFEWFYFAIERIQSHTSSATLRFSTNPLPPIHSSQRSRFCDQRNNDRSDFSALLPWWWNFEARTRETNCDPTHFRGRNNRGTPHSHRNQTGCQTLLAFRSNKSLQMWVACLEHRDNTSTIHAASRGERFPPWSRSAIPNTERHFPPISRGN